MLIKEIQVWSVARTVFPLAWVLSAVVVFGLYLAVDSLVDTLTNDILGASAIEPDVGVGVGLIFSLVFGFFSTVVITVLSVLTIELYNFLAGLGGGFSIRVSELDATTSHPEGRTSGTAGTEEE